MILSWLTLASCLDGAILMKGGIHHGWVIKGDVRSRCSILQLKRFSNRRQRISKGLMFLVLLGLGLCLTMVL